MLQFWLWHIYSIVSLENVNKHIPAKNVGSLVSDLLAKGFLGTFYPYIT